MNIEPFGVEIWMNEFENNCELNLAETCVHSITVAELLDLCGLPDDALKELLGLRLGYGAIPGSDRLRRAVAALYENQSPDNVLITHGTIGANSLVHQSMLSANDHAVAIVPTYQQHYSIPESIGARVSRLQLTPQENWLPDPERLRELVRDDTRLIAMTNPNNPTGSLMNEALLMEVVSIARSVDAWILCDEVYRGIDQEGAGTTISVADLYEKGISTGGMSKAFSLAGLRLGWVVAPGSVVETVMIHRDYNTISVGVIDDHLASLALENQATLLRRSRDITQGNLKVLAQWIDGEPAFSWVRPSSGTTALLKYHADLPSRDLCLELLRETGVMFTPGSTMGMEGYVRVGFANRRGDLEEGLQRVSSFFSTRFSSAATG